MSDVIENTFSSLSRLLNENLISSISGSTPGNVKVHGASKGFENFIRAVCSSRNKHEEDVVVQRELKVLQQRFTQPDISTSQIKDYMVRIIYCGMLGHDVNFACIHALKLAQHGKLQEKRIGYLAASLLLHENHELVLLLINTIQKDLSSSNLLENCMGLLAVCQLVNTEMAPMLLPSVLEKLKHPRAVVRKKAVMCLQKFHLKSPRSVQHLGDRFREALCDKDPGVMSAALHIYLQLIQENPAAHLSLTQGFVNTLTQVISRKLPSDMDYHSIPAPWGQIKLLKILAALGQGQERSSALMYDVLRETLERATVKDNAAFAILFECVVTITTIWPNRDLLHKAASYVGKFLRSKGNNLRFAGLKALGHLVRAGPEFVTDYQMIVVECLDDADQAIQRKTYDLLYQMTNTSNVEVICKRLMDYLVKSRDDFVQSELVAKITELVVSHKWYISTMNQLIEVRGDQTPPQICRSLLNIIQTVCKDSGPVGQTLREFVVQTYLTYTHRPTLPQHLLSVAVWVIGEYSHSIADFDTPSACDSFVQHYQSSSTEDGSRHYIISSLRKLFLNEQISPSDLQSFVNTLESSTKGHNLQQRILELKMLANVETTLKDHLRTACETSDKVIDFTLSFLDDYVTEALEGGSLAYKPRQIRLSELSKSSDVKSILEEINYDRHSSSVGSPGTGDSGEAGNGLPLEGSADSVHSGSGKIESRPSGLNLSGVKKVWGRGGLMQTNAPLAGVLRDVGQGERNTPEKPHQPPGKDEDEERQRKEDLAAALFSGVSGTSSTSSVTSSQGHEVHSDSAASAGLGPAERQMKLVDILVKQKPADGYDWRKFKKAEENSGGKSTQLDILDSDLKVETFSETSTNSSSENFMKTVFDSSSEAISTLHGGALQSQPSQEVYNTAGNQGQAEYLENPTVVENQSSLYYLLRSELTEEELQEQRQQLNESRDLS